MDKVYLHRYNDRQKKIMREREIMKVYTIIGGVNGTGKSSLIGTLKVLTTNLGVIIDAERVSDCLSKNINFTQETTLSEQKAEETAARAKALGYTIRLYYIGLDTPEECLARIANRVRRGGHDIPESDVRRRFAGRWEAVSKVLPYCDEGHFFDNDNGFVEVAEYKNGEFVLMGTEHPRWALELAGYLGGKNRG